MLDFYDICNKLILKRILYYNWVRSGNNPMVFDLVDENGVLKKHYYSRRKVYLEVGGVIKDFHKVEEFNGIIESRPTG